MGCDIHSVIQVRRDCDPLEKGKWKSIREGLEDRNYEVFARIADVRNAAGARCISRPRGLPKDFIHEVSKVAGYADRRSMYHDYNGDRMFIGDHSHSYLTAEELLKYNWDRVPWDYGFPPDLQSLLNTMEELSEEYGSENVRMVFGFDS